jgi:hypothetical protein
MNKDRIDMKELYQGFLAQKKATNRKLCPSTADLVGSFDRSASPRKKKKIIDHLADCAFCREEFAIIVRIQRVDVSSMRVESKSASAKQASPEEISVVSLFWRYAGALLGLSLIVASFFVAFRNNPQVEAQRDQEVRITLLNPEAHRVLSKPFKFRWKEITSTEYYVLELFDEALLPIWRIDRIYDLQLAIPPKVFNNLEPGRSYFWMVTAYSPDGKTAESTLARFSVRRRK